MEKQSIQYFNKRCKIPKFFQIRQKALPIDYEQYLDYYKNRCQGQRSLRDVRRILSLVFDSCRFIFSDFCENI
mgnify:CR=1 FL=1